MMRISSAWTGGFLQYGHDRDGGRSDRFTLIAEEGSGKTV